MELNEPPAHTHPLDAETTSGREDVLTDIDSTIVGATKSSIKKRVRFQNFFRKENSSDPTLDQIEIDRVDSELLSLKERKKRALDREVPIGAQLRAIYLLC